MQIDYKSIIIKSKNYVKWAWPGSCGRDLGHVTCGCLWHSAAVIPFKN